MHLTWPEATGLHDCNITLDNGEAARCTLALPEQLSPDTPLVLVLHYGGEPHGFYGRPLIEMLALPAWRSLNAVFVAPVASGGDWTTPRNRGFALDLLAAVERRYGTSPARRLLLGYSMGAIGTWHLLDHAPDCFAAAVPMAGPAPALVQPLSTPVHAINSSADQLFPVTATVTALEALKAAGAPVTFTVVDGIDHFAVPRFGDALAALAPWSAGQGRKLP